MGKFAINENTEFVNWYAVQGGNWTYSAGSWNIEYYWGLDKGSFSYEKALKMAKEMKEEYEHIDGVQITTVRIPVDLDRLVFEEEAEIDWETVWERDNKEPWEE